MRDMADSSATINVAERDIICSKAQESPMAKQALKKRSVRGSRTGRPIMALLDLLGRRWILRILWELRAGSLGFRALQARCGQMSPSVLSQRLRDLQTARIVEAGEGADYRLTAPG